ncbi:hypothetical protein Y046_3904 [Burkholderia pseudomallei MSHR2990]|nr:hypothetical protein Y046_3904 [Burkholderia pseudomallei MSHR2990]
MPRHDPARHDTTRRGATRREAFARPARRAHARDGGRRGRSVCEARRDVRAIGGPDAARARGNLVAADEVAGDRLQVRAVRRVDVERGERDDRHVRLAADLRGDRHDDRHADRHVVIERGLHAGLDPDAVADRKRRRVAVGHQASHGRHVVRVDEERRPLAGIAGAAVRPAVADLELVGRARRRIHARRARPRVPVLIEHALIDDHRKEPARADRRRRAGDRDRRRRGGRADETEQAAHQQRERPAVLVRRARDGGLHGGHVVLAGRERRRLEPGGHARHVPVARLHVAAR